MSATYRAIGDRVVRVETDRDGTVTVARCDGVEVAVMVAAGLNLLVHSDRLMKALRRIEESTRRPEPLDVEDLHKTYPVRLVDQPTEPIPIRRAPKPKFETWYGEH